MGPRSWRGCSVGGQAHAEFRARVLTVQRVALLSQAHYKAPECHCIAVWPFTVSLCIPVSGEPRAPDIFGCQPDVPVLFISSSYTWTNQHYVALVGCASASNICHGQRVSRLTYKLSLLWDEFSRLTSQAGIVSIRGTSLFQQMLPLDLKGSKLATILHAYRYTQQWCKVAMWFCGWIVLDRDGKGLTWWTDGDLNILIVS